MQLQQRNNVTVMGHGPITLIFGHGFGCDQRMWRFVAPGFADRYRVVLYDLVGSGGSDLHAYYRHKYERLEGYAADLLEIIEQFAEGPVVLIGHSVSAMIGVLADRMRPGVVAAHVMVGPSPRYLDDEGYVGGFTRADIDSLLDTLESNYLGWSSTMAPSIMGAPDRPELGEELTSSFCRTDPAIARHFAGVTFLSDNRKEVQGLTTPSLILQCSDDLIAPVEVGDYLHAAMPGSVLCLVENIGHCPHMSAPDACAEAIERFLDAGPGRPHAA
ncbi:alpha/beta hydrolase [Pseudomonas sp. DTU_2021_1001937_2_SI_NGA_ILE_001]|uniref:alpha/beta fold hydrolase n=1 Tax=Pseudomonas sp. DTU_2021_1001937_2_SI_NGA_ILE_001 TaxID=3077589 RepID=UPI0028FC3195|nr:alpha/beta hydrolase [Pseudomonas sp. DTU_2021_1001937_2_SI_NGA_ILE_001]WNW13765.1 alpha/beta hydrolase [Pseudomonas sp. DTU_2021_1001937_2_SI_NGA_ILE_001]